jgi:two-component system repressor protein LuxO
MPKRNLSLIMVEDSESLAAIYTGYLEDQVVDIVHVTTLAQATELLARWTPDLMLLDIELPDGSGMDLLRATMTSKTGIEVIVMTAHGSSKMAIESIHLGAFDFLTKPFDADRLQVTMANAIAHRSLSKKVEVFSAIERDSYGGFIGHSLSMQAVYRTIDSVAVSDATAFIVGESGTGKELAAEAIHAQSKRSHRVLHTINCGAIPGELMESELFGHVKGAFTGATASRDGAATVADGGTLFLDEICEMDLELQKKLLRFIQSGEFQRVGSNKIERVDIRFVCATNKNPLDEVRAGRFREDLYYRLHVVPVSLPPLRDRDDDVLLIAKHFLAEFAHREGKAFEAFSPAAEQRMLSYPWPGNVRELQNTVQNIVVLNNADIVERGMLPAQLLGCAPMAVNQTLNAASHQPAVNEPVVGDSLDSEPVNRARYDIEPLWITEKRAIESAIALCDGNVNRAAGLLEVAPSTVYRKTQSWKKSSNS